MNSFQFYFYSTANEKKKSSLERVFVELIKKIELYEKQYDLTLNLYKIEWEQEVKNLNESFNKSIEEAKKVYDKTFAEMEGEDDHMRHSYANHVSGLNYLDRIHSEEKDNIKQRYSDFFDLYSKSLLTALYSLIESNLKEICDIISKDFEQKLKYEHLDSRDYLNTSLNYFELVIQMPVVSLIPFISKLKDIQFIRNRIIHTDSKFTVDNERTIEEIVKKSKSALGLNKDDGINILRIKKPQFILDLFELIRELFEELFWLIDIEQQNKILKKGLEFWFGILDENIFIRNIQLSKKGNGKRNIEFDLSSRKKSIPKFKCRVAISRANKNSLEVFNQTSSSAIDEFNESVNSIKFFLYDYVFELFNQSKKGIKIKVMMF